MAGMDRRTFLRTLARAGAGAAALGTMPSWATAAPSSAEPAELIERNAWPEHLETTLPALGHSWITRNDRFFVRSHFPVPSVDPAGYKLEISGLVRNPAGMTLADLRALPRVESVHTLECAGNGRALYRLPNTSGTQWERGAVGNAAWGGVKLLFLLRRAEVLPEAKHVWFEAADAATLPEAPRFVRSIPIEKAMDDKTLLALTMNGEPLPRLHGGPLRVVVPGWYAMASTKWVTRVRVEATPSYNHFMTNGYRYVYPGEGPFQAPVEEMKVKSMITRPLEGSREELGKVRIQGFAWAGEAGVRLVEISADQGKSWQPAGFMGDTEPLAWRAWATEIEVTSPARMTVMARATDGNGEMQPVEARANAGGYANNSIHGVRFRVA